MGGGLDHLNSVLVQGGRSPGRRVVFQTLCFLRAQVGSSCRGDGMLGTVAFHRSASRGPRRILSLQQDFLYGLELWNSGIHENMIVMSPDHPPWNAGMKSSRPVSGGRGGQGRKHGLSQEGRDNSLYLTREVLSMCSHPWAPKSVCT